MISFLASFRTSLFIYVFLKFQYVNHGEKFPSTFLAILTPRLTHRRPLYAGPVNAGPVNAGPVTAGPVNAGPVNAGPVNAGPVNAGPVNAGPVNAGPFDAIEGKLTP